MISSFTGIKISGSNLDHGNSIHDSLESMGRIKIALPGPGDAILTDEVVEIAKSIHAQEKRPHEKELVNLYTPFLIELFRQSDADLRLVNSEFYQWLQVPSGQSKCALKPDLFSAYHALIHYYPPYSDAPNCSVPRCFGKFLGWNNRQSIHCVLDCKWKINMEGFGEICKYLQISGEDCRDVYGGWLHLKGILFDIENFWMIQSFGNAITDVEKCMWTQPGSKSLILNFLTPLDPWLQAIQALSRELEVEVLDRSGTETRESAWLGSGANGRVFELVDGRVLKVVVGSKSDETQQEYLIMLELQRNDAVNSVVFPVVHDSFRDGVVRGIVKFAGYLLASRGQHLQKPFPIEALANALVALHSNNIIHGDPRIENALLLNGTVKWIDFRDSVLVTAKVNIRRDVTILLRSVAGVEVSDENIDRYVDNPGVGILLELLRRL